MNDYSDNIWHSMSDKALMETIGTFVKQHRLNQSRTQDEVATEAGISRSTLSLLEKGEPITLPTLIQVLRVLDLLHVMSAFQLEPQTSPLQLAKQERDQRKRARPKKPTDNEPTEW